MIHATAEAHIREFGLRMPSFRVLVNTPSPQGSTGITTNVFPSMTLGCGAVAGNSTSDNVGPLNLINIKRIAYAARKAEDAFENAPARESSAGVDRRTVVAAVERYLAKRGVEPAPAATSSVVDRFLAAKRTASVAAYEPAAPAAQPAPPAETVHIVDFVCEDDVRRAIGQSKKIYIGPKTIVTPSARDLALATDTLVLTGR